MVCTHAAPALGGLGPPRSCRVLAHCPACEAFRVWGLGALEDVVLAIDTDGGRQTDEGRGEVGTDVVIGELDADGVC